MDHQSFYFKDADAFEAWLEANAESTDSVWVKMAKKSSGIPSVDQEKAVEVALCFGWIDSQRNGLDDTWFLQRFTPRRRRSNWSKINRRRAEALMAAGRMRPAGMAEVERAREDGRWEAATDPGASDEPQAGEA